MKNTISLFIISSFLFTSCSKDQTSIFLKDTSQFDECVSKNILQFNSMEEFSTLNQELHLESINQLSKSSSLSGFVSQANYLDELEYETNVTNLLVSEEDEITDPYLASLVNVEGEIIIGDFIYKLGNQYCFAFQDCEGKNMIPAFYDQLKTGTVHLKDGESLNFDPKLFVFKVDKILVDLESRASEADKYVFQNKRRVKGKMWQTNWLVYKSSGVKTKMQKKKWGFWVKTNADEVSVSWDVTFYNTLLNSPSSFEACEFPGEPILVEYSSLSDSKTESDVKKVSKTFHYVAGGGVTTGGGSTTPSESPGLPYKLVKHSAYRNSMSDHTVVYDNATHATCTLHWSACSNSTTSCDEGTSTGIIVPPTPCSPPCPTGYICISGDCIELIDNSCVPPCGPDEDCHNGVCIPH